jgi:hypothetical protein
MNSGSISALRLRANRCPSPKLYQHLERLPTRALFGFAPGQTESGTHMGSQSPGEESSDRRIQMRPSALITGFSSGDHALSSTVVTMMQSAKSLVSGGTELGVSDASQFASRPLLPNSRPLGSHYHKSGSPVARRPPFIGMWLLSSWGRFPHSDNLVYRDLSVW